MPIAYRPKSHQNGQNSIAVASGANANLSPDDIAQAAEDIKSAAKELVVDIEPKWQAYLIEDWIKDIKLRVRATQIRTEQEKLAAMESKLETLVSPEQRRAMELEKIEAELA